MVNSPTMLALVAAAQLASVALAREPAAGGVREGFARPLSRVRASQEDLDVRPGRWETSLKTPAIEALLADPMQLPGRSVAWGRSLAAATGLADMAALSDELLGLATESPPATRTDASTVAASGLPAPGAGVPAAVADAVAQISLAVLRAKPLLAKASAGLSEEERARLSQRLMERLFHGPAERLDPRLFELAARFDQGALLEATRLIAEAVDHAAGALALATPIDKALPRTLVVAGSTVTLGGPGDDEYSAEELSRSTLVLDLGGKNRYLAAPAAAGPGEVRVVLDLGSEVVIDSSGSVATGRFGIGLLHLGNSGGAKRLRGGRFSLGAGFFGAGLLVARGPGSRFESGDFSQGAAAFGLGVLDVDGAQPFFSAPINAQGFGFTRGVGLLRVRGRGAKLECGLVYPDPRDAAAAVSLCQGAGYGPRAFAAGGFGLALVESNEAQLDSNYFSQGLGYWHGFGGLYFKGNGARVQSRRYGQGAGIHTALGALDLEGQDNRLLHWGVGPGFGWDWGIGSASVRGERNELYADWASGKGDDNGHGFVRVEGSGNRIRLGELATGTLKRSTPGYGLAIVSGTANAIWLAAPSSAVAAGLTLQPSLWGVLEIHGSATLHPTLTLEPPRYRSMDAEFAEAARRDRERNAARLAEADRLPAPERLKRWLFLAAEGALDDRSPSEALSRLLSLPDAEAAMLPGLVAPGHFDEFIQLRTIIPAYGRRIAPALAKAASAASGSRKALLLGMFRQFPVSSGLKAALAAANDPDWRVRQEALGTLGSLFDRSGGEEPGRVAFLKEALALCGRRDPRSSVPADAVGRIGQQRPVDLLAALALAGGTPGDRLSVALRAPDPFSPVPADTLNAFAEAIGSRAETCRRALSRELGDVERLEGRAAGRLAEAVDQGAPELLAVAVAALGLLGRAEDAGRIARRLTDPSGLVREAAAVGLARLGPAAGGAIRSALASPDPVERAMAVVAAAQSFDPEVFRLLARGFEDPDESVRLAAVASPSAAQAPLRKLRKEFAQALERLAAGDPSPSVRASAAHASASCR